VVGDIAHSIDALSKALVGIKREYPYFARVREELYARMAKRANYPDFPVKPQRFVADVRKAMPANGIIALDNGIYKVWFGRNYAAAAPNTVLLDNALATMGAGLPSAIEAARLYPERNVMAICGDGGFMMNSQEMETAIRLKVNLVVLILNDGAYGMIRWKQSAMKLQDFGLEFGNPDFVMYANSYGAKGHRVETTESFLPLIKKCFKEGGVHLIDLPVDYSENAKELIDELREKVCVI
jgi:acetolactate synthase-1/2/3 large subunit